MSAVLGLISSINKAFSSSSSNIRAGDSSDDERDTTGGIRTISVAAGETIFNINIFIMSYRFDDIYILTSCSLRINPSNST